MLGHLTFGVVLNLVGAHERSVIAEPARFPFAERGEVGRVRFGR